MKDNLQKYKILKTSDPESYYQKFGPFGLRKIPTNKVAADFGVPMAEYEFLTRRHVNEWNEIPQRKYYERLLYEAHGLTHSGCTLTESTFS